MTVSARDYDPPVGAGSPSFGEIGSPFIDFDRPSAPNELFSDMMSRIHGGATISYRYRIICTDGSCGNDCSQTVNCPHASACGDGISTFTTQAAQTRVTDPCSNVLLLCSFIGKQGICRKWMAFTHTWYEQGRIKEERACNSLVASRIQTWADECAYEI